MADGAGSAPPCQAGGAVVSVSLDFQRRRLPALGNCCAGALAAASAAACAALLYLLTGRGG